ncbi:tRNA(Ile)-lysidine synthase [Peptoclostridium litorale DSM 5388]|uniref:tRNA(Ile)-lysidine synthase n=1 Tax=Peptoclostridium litorale DSM 5388 TaxID=1121324 RepID=A0A069RL19_PEPLI|nr:tRNA lysidine(34) synthetase TilS [Peptoclostridium litorale]KDR94917.1 tRNA(Ile)-lysidine synthase TilS [Peptoclostridium litorale DSM 5388]SIN95624.1 tRNA(Ile)-lysidine synthase [Peptoclostridium litorale DSM 5388]
MVVEKVKKTIEDNGLINKGDSVIVALSGGPDSICLLRVLNEIKDEYGIKLYAAHLNHKIRGMEAQKDAVFCVRTCDEMGIVCFVKAYDVPAYSKENGLSIEEGARKLRYNMFFELKESLGAQSIAVAHNLDDQAETVLMRMMRGSGLEGLKGMDYRRADGIIRPLIDVTRDEIEKHIKENEIDFRIDESNLEEVYSRNKVRLSLIPYIEKSFNPNIKKALSRMSRLLGDDCDYINSRAEESFERLCKKNSDKSIRIDANELCSLHRAISTRLVRMSVEHVLEDIKGFELVHVEDVMGLAGKGREGASIDLPRNMAALKRGNDVIVGIRDEILPKESKSESFSYTLPKEGSIFIKEIGMEIDSSTMQKKEGSKFKYEKGCIYLDLDKIDGKVTVRSRKEGDRIRPVGLGGSKKVKDIFIDMKIERSERDKIPVISDGKGIMWIYGYRIGDDYKVDGKTSSVIKISARKR